MYVCLSPVCQDVSLQCRLLASPKGFHVYGNNTFALDDIDSAILLLLEHIEYAAGNISGALFTQAIQYLVGIIACLREEYLLREVGKHVCHGGARTDSGKLNARTQIELLIL